jgi:hypothetical protein
MVFFEINLIVLRLNRKWRSGFCRRTIISVCKGRPLTRSGAA